MNKRALFLSIAISTFILVMVSGVFSVYKAFASADRTTAQIQPISQTAFPATVVAPTIPAIQQVTPEQAAAIAAAYIDREDVYSVESAVLDTVTVYKVIFSSGITIYVGLDGQILRVENPEYSVSQSSESSTSPITIEHSEDGEHEDEEDD